MYKILLFGKELKQTMKLVNEEKKKIQIKIFIIMNIYN